MAAALLIAPVLLVLFVLHGLLRHPLRHYPGPFWAWFSRIPYWRATVRGDQIRWMEALHRRYGPVVRYGPWDLSYTDADAWRDVQAAPRRDRAENGKQVVFEAPPANGVRSLMTADADAHARIRRVFAPAFSDRALKAQEPLFRTYADLMVARMREAAAQGRPCELVQMFNFVTFDIMGDLAFGQPLDLLKSAEYSSWVAAIFQSIKILPVVQIVQYYPLLRALFALVEPKWVAEMRLAHFQHTADRVDRRLATKRDQPDIWTLVLAEGGGTPALSLEEMHINAELFMTAGSETTSSLLSALVYYLLANPSKMELLVKEIRTSFGTGEDLTLERLAQLSYLNACIQEGLRIHPPAAFGVPRVTPPGGNVVCGRWVPGGTTINPTHAAMYRSPANFRHPDAFVPERWLGDPAYAADKRHACQPFSTGPRNCIGQAMAWHEVRLVLTKTLFNFDLELCDPKQNWPDQNVYAIWERKPLWCRLTPVKI